MSRFLPLTFVVLFLVSLWNPLFAQDMHTIQSNCMAEVQNFCSGVKHDTEAIKQCAVAAGQAIGRLQSDISEALIRLHGSFLGNAIVRWRLARELSR